MARSARLNPGLKKPAPPTRLLHDERGAVAVEFAFLALPFIAFLYAIIETGLLLFAGQALDTAVANTSRLIRTGQAQAQGFDEGKFKESVCKQVDVLFDCAKLKIRVEKLNSFADFSTDDPVDPQTKQLKADFQYGYEDTVGGDIVLVRTFYEWPTFLRLFGFDLSTLANGNHLFRATSAFRNEPFPPPAG